LATDSENKGDQSNKSGQQNNENRRPLGAMKSGTFMDQLFHNVPFGSKSMNNTNYGGTSKTISLLIQVNSRKLSLKNLSDWAFQLLQWRIFLALSTVCTATDSTGKFISIK
jgi:hypothetical protein